MTTTKWFLPSVSIALGVAFMATLTIGGDLRTGVSALGVMAVVALGVLVAGRSELVRGLRGDGRTSTGKVSIAGRRSPRGSRH